MRPSRLGRYELLRHIATGGMARLYLARVTGPGGFERHVVVKTIPPDRAGDSRFVGMFLDEARLIATLHHQHIAQVFEVGQDDEGHYFLAMEYVHGETVRQLLHSAEQRKATLSLDVGLSIACAAGAALHHAHERRDVQGKPLGIVHRDVSPSNVILGFDGSIKLIDFGIAKAKTRTTETADGVIKGKAGYMAPEQARGYAVDRRSDVFSLGVLTYELTTQTRAFHSESQFETMRRTMHGEVELPSKRVAGFPPALEDVIMTALEVDPDDRFQDVESMRIGLEQVARELGFSLGAAPVIRALEQLFPHRPEPWLDAPRSAEDETTPILTLSEPVIMIVPRTPTGQRLARGTEDPTREPTSAEPVEPVEPVAQPIVDMATRPYVRPRSQELVAGASATLPLRPRRATPTPVPVITRPSVPLDPAPPLEPALARPSQPRVRASVVLPIPNSDSSPVQARLPTMPVRSGSSRVVAILAAAIAACVVVAIFIARGGKTEQQVGAAPVVPIATKPPVAPVLPPPPPAAPPQPPPQVADGTVLLGVTTNPEGATVVLDGVRLGVTPLTIRVPGGKAAAWLKVRKRGYVAVRNHVSLQHDVTWDVALRELFH